MPQQPPQITVTQGTEKAANREGRPRSTDSSPSSSKAPVKHRMSVSRSPIRSQAPLPPSPMLSQSQILRQPFPQNQSHSYPQTHHNHNSKQRRPSYAGIDTSDMSSSIGMPYAYNFNSSSLSQSGAYTSVSTGSLSPSSASFAASARTSALTSTVPVTSGSSPRASVPSLDSNYTSHSAQLRRHSESTQRRPSTAEVFDLMEREQDAIVLKLMREIQQLKEDNRALLQTVNMLSNPSSGSSARTSVSRSRRPSSVVFPEDVLDMSKASLHKHPSTSPDPHTPRSLVHQNGISDSSCMNSISREHSVINTVYP